MDMIKMGVFLAQLRKEQRLTQAELGEKLGVSNKTVSRWETGTYMPPVEMLQELSTLYAVSINELVSGERLSADAYKEKAEENMKAVLDASTFSLKEKIAFFKKKWLKEHVFNIVLAILAWLALVFVLKWQNVGTYVIGGFAGFAAAALYALLNNKMMAYVEKKVYD